MRDGVSGAPMNQGGVVRMVLLVMVGEGGARCRITMEITMVGAPERTTRMIITAGATIAAAAIEITVDTTPRISGIFKFGDECMGMQL